MLHERTLIKQRDKFSPPRTLALGFAAVILAGSLVLYLPFASVSGHSDYIDCLFTSTSAVCVTGLVTVDTGTHWSLFGQVVILALIQIGGLGIMAFATLFAMILGSRINLKQRLLMQQSVNISSLGGVVKVTRYLLLFTIFCELSGALVLFLRWWPEMGAGQAAWFGLFHSISAFNNAGFDIFGNYASLTGYAGDLTVNLAIGSLIILGGLGFYVSYELYSFKRQRRFSLHSRVVLLTTLGLVLGGTLIMLASEWNHAFQNMPILTRFLAAFMQSISPRTAGFNSIDLNTLHVSSQFLIIILMFIGASPGSTGGGVKTTTIAIVGAALMSQARGRKDCELLDKRIEYRDVMQAMTILVLYAGLMFLSAFLLSVFQPGEIKEIIFEAGSALGTVGLSLGLTTRLTMMGKIILIGTMFLGRLGPLTLGYALALNRKPADFRYPKGRIMVG